MKIYLVGGFVRDLVLNVVPKDRDYVVVGSTPEEMLANGFSQVGNHFPVFINPETGEEFALARKETKTGAGYNGFTTEHGADVTLEEDLFRRDLTINSMAKDPETGDIIDPYGGVDDCFKRILRHTSEAFTEDPLRVLRVARLAARLNFTVAPETLELMNVVACSEDFKTIPQDRIWKEISRGLTEPYPHLMFEILHEVGALNTSKMKGYLGAYYFFESYEPTYLDKLFKNVDLDTKMAIILSDMQQPTQYRIPKDICRIIEKLQKWFPKIGNYKELSGTEKIDIHNAIGTVGSLRTSTVFASVCTAGRILNDLYEAYASTSLDILKRWHNWQLFERDAAALRAISTERIIEVVANATNPKFMLHKIYLNAIYDTKQD